MSAERALLRRVKVLLECSNMESLQRQTDLIVREIQELLAQPEQIEQETKFNFDLERMKTAIESPISDVTVDDLAKQVKQEHVGIVRIIGGYPDNSERVVDWVRPYKYLKDGDRLYTAPPKRKPLTPQQISEGNQSMLNVTREAFKQGVKFAEKAHGITGGGK